MAAELIAIEVAYATANLQTVLTLTVSSESTIEQAIIASGILQQWPEIDLQKNKVGIFGQLCELDKVLNAGDRVEIYRPLQKDPMEARRQKAKIKR
jgi:putative ubiquitin-RnfH superfamily antitoxin RatB of RatAB toxin-antitoxin module